MPSSFALPKHHGIAHTDAGRPLSATPCSVYNRFAAAFPTHGGITIHKPISWHCLAPCFLVLGVDCVEWRGVTELTVGLGSGRWVGNGEEPIIILPTLSKKTAVSKEWVAVGNGLCLVQNVVRCAICTLQPALVQGRAHEER